MARMGGQVRKDAFSMRRRYFSLSNTVSCWQVYGARPSESGFGNLSICLSRLKFKS
jgi:hypothetical protein